MKHPRNLVRLARTPLDQMRWEDKKLVLVDIARPEFGRRTCIIRELPVKLLTAFECSRLMSHAHPKPCPGRRRAYWKKVFGFYQAQHAAGQRVGFPRNGVI